MIKDKNATQVKRKAEGYFAKGNLPRALDEYLSLKELLPRDMRVVQKIADIHHKLGNIAEAKENYKKAAEYFTKEGYWAKAVALNKIIIGLDPGDKEVQQQIADIYTSKGFSGQKIVLLAPKKKPEETVSRDEITATIPNAEHVESTGGWKIPLFSDLKAEAMNELIENLAIRRIPAGAHICKEGEPGNSMFVISDGWVEIFTENQDSGKIILDSLKEGDFFGEFGLLTNGKRHASAQAKSDIVLLEITSANFADLSKKHPTVPKILDEYFRNRMFDNVLRKSKVFDSLFTAERLEVIKKFDSTQVKKGSYIFKEGDKGDKLFFVKNGEVEISLIRKGDNVVIARLEAGDFFGEISLLTGNPRTASARAITDIDLLVIDEPSFKEIISDHPHIEHKLKGKMEERAKDTIQAYQSYEEMKKCLGMV